MVKTNETKPASLYPITEDLSGKSILITGGTGSFGQRMVKTILERYKPRRLIIFSRDELKQYEMAQVYSPVDYPCLRYFIGDVRDRERLTMAVRGVDIVIHAAALKHVPAAEYNPTECIHTNIGGAENLVMACVRSDVKRVIALSTDKAVNPINLYGASKLASDKIFVAANNLAGEGGVKFSVVRYGNVVGSRGSVVPLFRRLIAEGATSLPITDPRMTRFWITLQQGVDFVLSSLPAMVGGEVFVPKIPSMNMVDLARAMAPKLRHEHVGIRPGEKLHEAMITEDHARDTVELDDRYIIKPSIQFKAARGITGAAVPEGFRYASDTNPDFLDEERLHTLLNAD
jgi:UDP-N-acetylglucosamine 4,6-dehydratase